MTSIIRRYGLVGVQSTVPSLVPTGPAIGAPNLILDQQSTSIASGANSGAVTAGAPVGSLIVIWASCNAASGATLSNVTDSAGNTYTQAAQTAETDGNHFNTSLWYKANIANAIVNGTTTFSATTTTNNWTITAVSIANCNSGLDKTATTAISQAANTSMSISTGTLAQAIEIVIGHVFFSSGEGTFTEGSGFTQITASDANSGFGNLAYKIVNSTSSVTYAPSWVTSVFFTGVIASWKQ